MAMIEKNEGIRSMAEHRNQVDTSSRTGKADQKTEGKVIYAQASTDGVRYEVSGRAGEIATWWQDMNKQEEKMAAEAASVEGEEEIQEEQKEQELLWQKKKEDPYSDAEESIRKLERLLERLRKQQQKKEQKTTKRRLVYNHRKISTAIGGAKTLIQASNAVASANSNLSAVRRKAASGKYDEAEIAIAKSHAMKMVRTARKKLRHIKLEASQEKINDMTENGKRQDTNDAAISRKQYIKLKDELQKLQKELRREEKQYKNMHRRREDWELLQADMEYLRRKIELMRSEERRSAVDMAMQQAEASSAAPVAPEAAINAAPAAEATSAADNTQQMTAAAVADASMAAAATSVDMMV